ncbi:zinc-binding dehydrogenase [Shimazuella sp. AN120528]|uniref:quinone oxidoreductase family protein n=1 Tax=Shimazuella soli TaxID=1892854 RepID=UPI001F115F79|nr:zinc-binding dehydrogenase [Shimazuella soli]MCH5583516.1 zinc-binding dehydrogenase [Shimazuella soli]
MKAIIIPQFGEASVLTQKEVITPQPGLGEVTIDVAYAGINYAEVLFRKGVVADLSLPFVPGIEVSGTIREIGEGVTGFQIGQAVAALTIVGGGGYAEVVKVDADLVIALDQETKTIDMEVAAAFPSNVTTAMMILSDVAHMEKGETVLVHAAAGGVGSAIGQMARALGAARVIGVVGSKQKIAYAKSLGYNEVYLRDEYVEAIRGSGIDIVIDQVGGDARETGLSLLSPLGRLVVMGNASEAEDVAVSANELWFSSKAVLGFNLQLMSVYHPKAVAKAAKKALPYVVSGQVSVDVTDVVNLEDIAKAHKSIEDRTSKGKMVLQVKTT